MGTPEISRRETEVLMLLGESLTNAQIANRLVLSERTVESHVSSLLRKTGASDRRDLARLAGRARAAPARPPVPAGLPPPLEAVADAASYVGRSEVRAALEERWRRASHGRTLGVLITGDAGMGKTRAVAELAAACHREGGRVLYGACYEDLDAPFGPFVQAIEADAASLDDHALLARGRTRDTLALLSPGLARALRAERSARRPRPDREALLDAIGDWIAMRAAEGPVLLVIEDLHWATRSTLDAIRQVLRSAASPSVLLVATRRAAAGELPHGLDAFLADVRHLPTAVEIHLDGLTVEELAELTGTDIGIAARLHEQTGGNPLLASVLTSPDGGGAGTLEAVLAEREALLDQTARDVLDAAAVIGVDFDLDVLRRMGDRDLGSVIAGIERAIDVGLVRAPGEGAARFSFVHALIRDRRYDALPVHRRLELHSAAARALDGRDDALAERARHACLSVPMGSAELAVDLAGKAGDAADEVHAYDEAETHYHRGLAAAAALSPPDQARVRSLAVRRAGVRHRAGAPGAVGELVALAAESRRAGDVENLVRAATSLPQFGAPLVPDGPDHQVAEVVDAALAALPEGPSEARAVLELFRVQVRTFWDHGDHRLLVEMGTRYEAMARELHDPSALANVLVHASHFRSHPSQLGEFERIAIELEALGLQIDRLAVRLIGVSAQASATRCRGDLAGWRAGKDRYAAILGNRPVPWLQLAVASGRAHAAFYDGDLRAAEARARELAPLADAVGHGRAAWTGGVLLPVRRARAEDARLVPGLARVVAASPRVSWSHCFLAAALARSGDLDGAQQLIETVARAGFAIPEDYSWSIAFGELAEAAEVAGVPDAAEAVRRELGPYRGYLGLNGSAVARPFDESLAQAALAAGDHDEAEAVASDLVEWARAQRAPVFLARALVFLAAARRRGGASRVAVAPLADEALALAARYDVHAAAVDIDRYDLRA